MQHPTVIPFPVTRVRRRHVGPASYIVGEVRSADVEPGLCRCTSCGQTGWLLVLDRAPPPCPGCGGAVMVAS